MTSLKLALALSALSLASSAAAAAETKVLNDDAWFRRRSDLVQGMVKRQF